MSSNFFATVKKMDKNTWKGVKDCLVAGNFISETCTDLELCWFFLHGYVDASNILIEHEIPQGKEDNVSRGEKDLCVNLLMDEVKLKGDLNKLIQSIKTIQEGHRGGYLTECNDNPYILCFDTN